jgi:hypothetical protein
LPQPAAHDNGCTGARSTLGSLMPTQGVRAMTRSDTADKKMAARKR